MNQMEGVQNLRKAVYEWVTSRLYQLTLPSFKLKAEAAEPGSQKHKTLMHQGVNYLYRCRSSVSTAPLLTHTDGMVIVLANFLLETKEQGTPIDEADFTRWIFQHREIRNVLSRKTLD